MRVRCRIKIPERGWGKRREKHEVKKMDQKKKKNPLGESKKLTSELHYQLYRRKWCQTCLPTTSNYKTEQSI